MRKFISKNLKWIIIFLCLLAFFTISIIVYHKSAIGIDTKFYNFLETHLISDQFTPIAKIITSLGSATFLIGLSLSFFILVKDKKVSLYIIINLFIVAMLNLLIKNILQRERPVGIRLIEERGYSFPSGHSMVSLSFYGLLIFLIYKYIKNKYIKFLSIPVLGIIIISVGISRIYLGVHYTTDVLAGFILSLAYLIFFISFSGYLIKKDNNIKESLKKFLLSFKYAFTGIFETIKNERNIKIHLVAMTFVIIFGILFKITVFEWIICIILFGVVISAEIFNTAIENIVDNLVKEPNEYARMAKDASAGAVLFLAICSAIIGIIIFLPKIF